MAKYITVESPEVGDIAVHRTLELRFRVVSRVDAATQQVWLLISADTEVGPFPVRDYFFGRKAAD